MTTGSLLGIFAPAPPTPATLEIVFVVIEADSTEVGVVAAARPGVDDHQTGTFNWRTRAPSGVSTSFPFDEAITPAGTDWLAFGDYYTRQRNTLTGLPVHIIPHGWNGTRIVDITPGDATWGVGRTLHEGSVARANTAIAAILAANPGALPNFTILVSGGTNDASSGLSPDTWETNITAAVSDFRARVFQNGVSGAAIGTSAPVIFRGMSPEFIAANSGNPNAIENKMRKAQYSIPNARYWKQPEGQNTGDNVHPGLAGQRGDGIGAANTRDDTAPPVFTSPSSFSIYTGQKLGRAIVTDKPAWYYLTGTDAAQFEIVPIARSSAGGNINSARVDWFLRWTGNGNAPAPGAYNVTINAKGSAPAVATDPVVVTVVAAYGTLTETIVPTWTKAGHVTDIFNGQMQLPAVAFKRGLNILTIQNISGPASISTSAVASNGLIGVADANNTTNAANFYFYSAQDETVDVIATYTGSGPGMFWYNVNLVGTVASPSTSQIADNVPTTSSITCPASGIIAGAGFSIGDLTPPAGQTDLTDTPTDTAMYTGYRTTTGVFGVTSTGGFARLMASAWAKA